MVNLNGGKFMNIYFHFDSHNNNDAKNLKYHCASKKDTVRYSEKSLH